MSYLKFSSYLLILIAFSTTMKAQDSINILKNYNNQYNAERNFKNNMFYNPASMSGYSSSSFSEFGTGYYDDQQNAYRKQLGGGSKGLIVEARSFQKLSPEKSVWGSAGYQNLENKASQWNENLDFNRIAPYVTADSVGGALKLERYQFSGGYLHKINRWTIAGEISYQSQLGYRSRDPRLKSTTSDLYFNAGINYKIYKEFEIGIFGKFNKYTQNSSLRFASLIGRPYVYQMVGFGYSNYFFNGGTDPSETFEEFGYKAGLQMTNKQGKDFYIQAIAGRSNSIKSHSDSNTSTPFDISDLENKNFEFEGAKFFTIQQKHRLGIVTNYKVSIKTGAEYGYSANTGITEQIFKRKAYRNENYYATIKGFYQYTHSGLVLSATPFFGYEEIKERRIYPVTGQKFNYIYLGINWDYRQQIKENQILSFQPYFSKRTVSKSINALSSVNNQAITQWIMQDFIFQASDITTFGALLRYDIKPEKLPALFVGLQYQSQRIQEKNNNFTSISLGITF